MDIEVIASLNAIIGIFMPLVVKYVVNINQSRAFKSLIALLVSSFIGLLLLIFSGNSIDFSNVLVALGSIIIATDKSYQMYWKDKI